MLEIEQERQGQWYHGCEMLGMELWDLFPMLGADPAYALFFLSVTIFLSS